MKKAKQKILLFDCWTKGLIHIHRLKNELFNAEIDIVLLHTGSWGDEKYRDTHEFIEGIEVFDVGHFSSPSSALESIDPSVVLFLSMDPIMHRGFNRLAQSKRIKTILLYHGMHSVFHSLSSERRALKGFFKYLFLRIRGGIIRNLFGYIQILVKTSHSFNDYMNLTRDIFNKVIGKDIKVSRDDGTPDHICVFNRFDIDHAKKKYPNCQKINEIGLPDILRFPNVKNYLGPNLERKKIQQSKTVIYIGTGVRSTNMLSFDDHEYFNFLNSIKKKLNEHNYDIHFRLHYSRVNSIESLSRKNNHNFSMIDDNNFIDIINQSSLAICEPSTASLLPGFFAKKICFPVFDVYKDLKYGNALNSYPFSFLANDLDDLISNLLEKNFEDNKALHEWQSKAVGPLPASDFSKRFRLIVLDAINEQKVKWKN